MNLGWWYFQTMFQVRRPMNDSQAALVQKFASEPLEQSEAWVCCCFFFSFIDDRHAEHSDHLVSWPRGNCRAHAQSQGLWPVQAGRYTSCVSCQNRDHLLRILLEFHLFRDEHADFKDEMARLRQLRGKVKIRYFLYLFCPAEVVDLVRSIVM